MHLIVNDTYAGAYWPAYVGIVLILLDLIYGIVVVYMDDHATRRPPRFKQRMRRLYVSVALVFFTGVLLAIIGLVAGQIAYVNGQTSAISQLQGEAQRVYSLTLSHDQAGALLFGSEPVPLNNGTNVVLQQKGNGTWVLATPNAPTPLDTALNQG
jgi:ketosteroid isomerase-like protein